MFKRLLTFNHMSHEANTVTGVNVKVQTNIPQRRAWHGIKLAAWIHILH